MRRIVIVLFIAGFTLVAVDGLQPCAVWAQEVAAKSTVSGRHKEPTAALYFSGRLARIGLSKDQKEKIRAILLAHEGVLAETSARHIEKRRQLRTLIDDPGAVEDDLAALAVEIGHIEGELAIERNRVLKEVMSLLTLEQVAKLKYGRVAGKRRESGQPR